MENKRSERIGFFEGIGLTVKEGIEKRKKEPSSILYDALVMLIALAFSRFHIAFGAYPLATAFVAVLPSGVWLALISAVVGALSLGKGGIIHTVIVIIVVFLRIIIAGGDRRADGVLFSESIVLRISSAAIAAFIGSAYEVLLRGFSAASILYASATVSLSALFTFAFSGVFEGGISFREFVFGKQNLFSRRGRDKEKLELYLFQATFLLFIFLISISLKGYNVLGISPSYVFSSFVTLLVSRRFGAIRGLAVGFVSSLGISSIYSVAFALVGLASGLLFEVGVAYAFVGGGILLSIWSAYAGGILGFLGTFPEYAIASMLSLPLLRKIPTERDSGAKDEQSEKDAKDMVTATALAYRTSLTGSLDGLEAALVGVSSCLHKLGAEEEVVSLSDYRDTAICAIKSFCHECQSYPACVAESPAPCIESVDAIAAKLQKMERLFPTDVSIAPKYCHNTAALFEEIEKSTAFLESERRKKRKIEAIADEYDLFSKLISESRAAIERERAQNTVLSEKLTELFVSSGVSGGVIMAFGERRKYFVGAGEDKDGSLVTSPRLHEGIEELAGVKLGVPEYYRKGDIALFECKSAPMYEVEFATVGKPSDEKSVSGDTAISFESVDGHFYSLIADGMGTGDGAHKTSDFTADFLSRILNSSCTKSTAFHILNHVIKSRNEECSSSVDLFDFDLLTGEALFFKCGAAASYVKRDNSIFRIRSETAPLGLMKSLDAERIRVEIKDGDSVIMISDGISESSEDSTWLIELLSGKRCENLREYAELILLGALENSVSNDDMSVSVMRIIKK